MGKQMPRPVLKMPDAKIVSTIEHMSRSSRNRMFFTSHNHLAQQTGLHPKQVQGIVRKLRKEGYIDVDATGNYKQPDLDLYISPNWPTGT